MILFGGISASNEILEDVWEWDGNAWTQVLQTAGNPANAAVIPLVYDAQRRKVVLFGGKSGIDYATDIWEWNGSRWRMIEKTDPEGDGNAPGRMSHAAAYDIMRGRIVVFGGSIYPTVVGDTWEWDSASASSPGMVLAIPFTPATTLNDEVLTVQGVTTAWVAGGIGRRESSTVNGARLYFWRAGRWQALDDNEASSSSPGLLQWSTIDPSVLSTLFLGAQRTLNLAVAPVAPTGDGDSYGTIATDYVEVVVRYHREFLGAQ